MDSAERFTTMVNRPAAAPHLDIMAALIGASFDPAGDPGQVVLELDRLAALCEPNFDSIMHTLFTSGRLRGNTGDYTDPRNSFMHVVLQRGLGIPITLGVCAIEVGRRLDVPVQGVGLPGHFFIECEGRYGDPFAQGAIHAADDVEAAWRAASRNPQPFDRRMLQPAHPRTILLRMLNNLKNTLVAMDEPGPLRVLAKLRSAFPECAGEREEYARWVRNWN